MRERADGEETLHDAARRFGPRAPPRRYPITSETRDSTSRTYGHLPVLPSEHRWRLPLSGCMTVWFGCRTLPVFHKFHKFSRHAARRPMPGPISRRTCSASGGGAKCERICVATIQRDRRKGVCRAPNRAQAHPGARGPRPATRRPRAARGALLAFRAMLL